MKPSIVIQFIIFIALAMVSCARPALEPKSKFPAACGGYTNYHALTDKDAALFADVYNVEPALTPYAVATQVVAGTNYRFLCRDAGKQEYVVTIFVPLPCYADTQQPKVVSVSF